MSIRLYHGSPEKSFVPTFGLGDDRHDQEARERMVALAYDEKRNPLRRTFDNLLEEDA